MEVRSGHPNQKWGYYSSDGLGYHEYLQWCEDHRAEPLFVINCGMACMFESGEVAPLNQLDEWVQDALDAVEYANGPVTSRWGALRMGAIHGAWCLGCCWLLMALLFVGGVMNLAWIALLALLVAAEKLLPGGRRVGQAAGLALIVWGALVAFA